MRRALGGLAAAALLFGALYLALAAVAAWAGDPSTGVLAAAALSILVAIAGFWFALAARLRAAALQADVARLSRSLDAAIADLSARTARETTAVQDLRTELKTEIEALAARSASRIRAETRPVAEFRDNIVSLPPPGKPRAEEEATPEPETVVGIGMLIAHAMASGPPEISLQPIVSIGKGEAAGFEAFVHLEREDGEGVNLRHLPAGLASVSAAEFEAWMAEGVVALAGSALAGPDTPIHLPLTEAVLSDPSALDRVAAAVRAMPTSAERLVVGLPSAIIERPGRHAEALDLVRDLGVRVAAELTGGGKDTMERLNKAGIGIVRLHCNRLLGRVKGGKGALAPARLVEAALALDISVIAIDVATDEDAVILIDLGLLLMTGDRFSRPRRLKPSAAEARDRLAQG